jgi:putative transcriptional regulator
MPVPPKRSPFRSGGVTRQTIIAIEQGRYSPTLEIAFQIARVFRVPLDAVFRDPDSEETL